MTSQLNHIIIERFFLKNQLCILFEKDKKIEYISPHAAALLGYSMPEMIGKQLINFIHPDYVNGIKKTYRLLKSIKEVNFTNFQIGLNSKKSQKIYMEAYGTLKTDDRNKSFGIIFLNEINDQRYEENLRQTNERRLKLAEEAANFGIWEWDIIKEHIYISDHAEDILHFKKRSFNGSESDFWAGFNEDDVKNMQKELSKCIDKDKKLNVRLHLKHHAKNSGWIKIMGDLKRNTNGEARKLFGIVQNIDEIVRYENRILKKNQELVEKNSDKNRFFSIVAHDIRTPFNAILGFSEILFEDYYELDDTSRLKYLDTIRRSGIHTYEFIENLLVWTRSQMNKISFSPDNLKLYEIFEILNNIFKPVYSKKNIELIIDCRKNVTVFADEDMLKTSLRNIVSNAIKYSYPKGQITIAARTLGGKTEISVKDQGTGMDQEKANSLFELNKGFSTPGTNNETGTGLGMIICKEFINRNKGKINVVSKKGEGTTFIVTLPSGKS